jgi:hypothetical protein
MRSAFIAVVAVLVVTGTAFADIPKMISYQGRVTDDTGGPVADGTYNMRFRIYDAETGGTMEWDSGTHSEQVEGGVFNVLLGESPHSGLNLEFDEDYWLLVTFDGVNQTPRQRLTSTGYAYMASGLVPGTEVEGSGLGAVLQATNNRTASGNSYGLQGNAYSTTGRGVYGYAGATTGTCSGVHGWTTSTEGRGVFGRANATTGSNYGGYFESSSSSGRGVYGEGPGVGVEGYASTTTDDYAYGGWFKSSSNRGSGVRAYATSTTGDYATYGVYGRSYASCDGSIGVYGRSSYNNNFGGTYGVYGRSDGRQNTEGEPEPVGVFGYQSNAGSSWGVGGCFVSEALFGTGVRGVADDWLGVGVHGQGHPGGHFEDTSASGWASVGYGSHKVSGTGSVNFVQNHPNNSDEVIVYAAPEGDEVATYTRGTARLVAGEATVALGETFKWVTNPDIGLTAHLTPRGDCSGLYVASLSTTEMMVRELGGGTSGVTFDYIVYGLRIGFEEVTVVQKKEREAYIPSMDDHREMYAAYPDLRRYNALERFKAMPTASGSSKPLDLGASEALRSAIQEYDPSTMIPSTLYPSTPLGTGRTGTTVHGAIESRTQRARRARQETEAGGPQNQEPAMPARMLGRSCSG